MAIPILQDIDSKGDITLAATRSLYFADEKIKIGASTNTPGAETLQIGYNADASGAQAIAFGYGGEASGAQSIAMGYDPLASGSQSIAIGYNMTASGTRTVAIGYSDTFSEASTLCTDLDMLARTGDGAILNLQTSDTNINIDDVLGSIKFSAPEEGSGTDAILTGAEISAVAEGSFTAAYNQTSLQFKVGASEAASTALTIYSDKKVTLAGDLMLASATPVIYFTDSDTGADSHISASSSSGSMSISADYSNESSTTKMFFYCDGDEVGHFRGNNAYVGSLRLFPEKNANTSQGIFFGTETAGAFDGTSAFSDTRVMSMDASSVLHLYPGTTTDGAIKIASQGTGTVTIAGDLDVTGSVKCSDNLRRDTPGGANIGGSNVYTFPLVENDNFAATLPNASCSIALTVVTENIGQSGIIVLTNPASVGSLSIAALPSYMLTPSGATVNFDTSANGVSVISYYVVATDKVLCNYIGNFA